MRELEREIERKLVNLKEKRVGEERILETGKVGFIKLYQEYKEDKRGTV